MENFNTVPDKGTFGGSVEVVNQNFSLAQQEMEVLQNKCENESARAIEAENSLRQLYNNLQQSQPIPVTSLPATGEAGKIYRLAGTTSYADYMYAEGALTTPIKMAEYNNAIDDEPTAGSNNLVKSGGVDKLSAKSLIEAYKADDEIDYNKSEENNQIVNIKDEGMYITDKNGNIEEILSTFNNLSIAFAAQKYINTGAPVSPSNNSKQFRTIVHITDVHGDIKRLKRAFTVAKLLNATIVCTGDMVRFYCSDDFSEFEECIKNYAGDYVHCLGNHESWHATEISFPYTKFIEPFYSERNWNLGGAGKTYYYYDDAQYKIRFICLNQWEKYTNAQSTHSYISDEQAAWFCTTLQNIPDGYGVIVVEHSPDFNLNSATIPNEKFKQPSMYAESTSISMAISEIIDAFVGKKIISKTYGIYGTESVLTVNGDFINITNNEFICFMNGHNHGDAICYVPNVENRLLNLNETCTCAWINKNTNGKDGTDYPYFTELSDLNRQYGTSNQDAFNVYVIDRYNKKVKVVRIGSDVTSYLGDKRDYINVSYI